MNHLDYFQEKLDALKTQGQYRQFKANISSEFILEREGKSLLNLASNDYLGLAGNLALREAFF